MYQLLKIGLISSLCFLGQYAHTQTVDQTTFDEAIDYINCRIAEISFHDQHQQPHFLVFLKETDDCDVAKYKGSFNTILQAFFRQRKLGKNQQLAAFINTFKLKYESKNSDANQYKLVIDTLLKLPEIITFQQRHQATYIGVSKEIDEKIYDQFGLNIDKTIEEVTPVQGEIKTFRDTSPAGSDTYLNLNGGERSNNELQNDTNFDNKNPDKKFTLDQRTFFSKYRLVILVFFLLLGFALYWIQKNGLPFKRTRHIADNQPNNRANSINSDEVNKLKEQIESIKIISASMQEELNRLKFRVNEFHEQFNPTPLLDHSTKELDETQSDAVSNFESTTIEWNDVSIDENPKNTDDNSAVVVSPSNHTIKFYMPIANEQGIFDSNEATDIFKRPYSVYQFLMVSPNDKHAEFRIHDDIATMIRALDNFDTYLKPVCRSSSILHKNATKIITVDNGVAIKEGEQWRVITKTVIKYG